MESIAWMAWTLPTAIFFVALAGPWEVRTRLADVDSTASRDGGVWLRDTLSVGTPLMPILVPTHAPVC
ncbi:DUF2160 domain-containing protein, partial [Bradyrhizobium sp. INPA01-394B]|nr:DUF2160 domain-containing protein [Bradyrhizobium campsiandrae]